jgi:hypothetical protein
MAKKAGVAWRQCGGSSSASKAHHHGISENKMAACGKLENGVMAAMAIEA